ncbi:MAG: adenylate/guanylate cyclase domain-containing protein [Verrucomicrobiales bacterium]|nr:adenylate/guanylate cyclase domain-containing protein [Verrucomicrobiales bacterium]
MPFRKKLQFLLIMLVGVSCGLLLWLSLRKANRLTFELIQEKVLSIAVSTAPTVDGDIVEQLKNRNQDGSPEYNVIRDQLRSVRDANDTGALPVRFIYLMRQLPDGSWEYVVDAEEEGEDKSYLGDPAEFEKEEEEPSLESARADEAYSRDSFGTWLSAFAPVTNSKGEVVAVVGIDIKAQRVQHLLRQLLLGDLAAMLAALLLASALAAWLSGKITRPLTELRDFVREVGRGNFGTRMDVKSNDEFGELASAINQMVDGLEERESLKGALVHYVRSQAGDTKLMEDSSDSTDSEQKVTALVAELCGFRQLSSKLGSERVFALLNEYFSTMIDIVLRHGGSLEKSSDERVTAIFGATGKDTHQERHAVEAALDMQHALAKLLSEWRVETNKPVFLEVGIHSGIAIVNRSSAQDQLDYESVHSVIESAGEIVAIGKQKATKLVVSDRVAESLHHTFPLEMIDEESLEFVLFRVTMPLQTFG